MKNLVPASLAAFIFLFASCGGNDAVKTTDTTGKPKQEQTAGSAATVDSPQAKPGKIADAATILARKEVPILCYHQIRNWRATDSKTAKDYIVPIDVFKAHMKILADSGYHTILPDQLYDYLTTGAALPEKPVMLTFDDTDIDQYTVGWNEMKKYGFKGVFFIMTVSINRPPNYMSSDQIEELSDAGNVVASHTWNHERFTSYKTPEQWVTQIEKPNKKIQEITGKTPPYFAYPFGLWNKEGIPELKKRGIKAAFQLTAKRDENEPLYTIRRMIASGYWDAGHMLANMKGSFNKQTHTP